MPDTFYVPMPRSPATELADDIDHLETSIPVLNTDVFPDPPNLATIGVGSYSRSQLLTSVATSAAAATLTDDAQDWDVNEYQDNIIRIVNGTGAGQRRIIASNTSDTITVSAPWTVVPDATSDYDIVSQFVEPRSETVIYTGFATGALTGVTRGYEPEFSSRAWPGGTIIARVVAAHDIRSLQERVVLAEADIVTQQGFNPRVESLEDDRDALMLWYETQRLWGAV